MAVLLMAMTSGTARADDSKPAPRESFDKRILSERMPRMEVEDDWFRANEWQIDAFGTFSDVMGGKTYRDGFGGGIGANYFWSKNWGAGLEGYWWEGSLPGDKVVHNAGINIFYRWPIEDLRIAPYLFIGPGGHLNGEAEASAHGGAGLEWRFIEHFGLFADARYEWTTAPSDYVLYRTGIRYSF